jgi:hypothetical protein
MAGWFGMNGQIAYGRQYGNPAGPTAANKDMEP